MWIELEDKAEHLDSSKTKGIRLRFYRGVNSELKGYIKDFCKWLRKHYFFPIRCNIFVFKHSRFHISKGNTSVANFFYSEEKDSTSVPDIRIWIATGGYEKHIEKRGKPTVIDNYLMSIAHELTHYFQWYFYEFEKRSNRSIENEASRWAKYLAIEYLIWKDIYFVDENDIIHVRQLD